jgi:hypothetical protein
MAVPVIVRLTLAALLFTLTEQGREPFLAVAGEIDNATAWGGIARRPFQFGEAGQDRGAERARKMMTSLAPVEAGPAQRAARMAERIGRDLQAIGKETFALGGQFDVLLALTHEALLLHAVEHLHPEIAGEMIVADPGAAQRRVLWSGSHPHVAGAGREALEAFEYGGDIGVAEAIIAVAALLFLFDQPSGLELGKVRTRGLRRDARLVGELAGGQRATGHQRRQHVGARGVANQGCDHRDVGARFHTSTIDEALASIKRVHYAGFEIPKAADVHHRFYPLPARSVQARAA